ncbi:6770_t:CDS:2 [Ambispora gerdemannii]|uniref:6770_t:CDS:1 n=1 Tax=Ambispora gerdemannii TaxID=144530 RepID=A0A9N8VCC5_9GLOM|nr:6770_t:CDS:2 [Ambispora gerdemannii]
MPLCALSAWPTHKTGMISYKTIQQRLKSDEIAEFYANANASSKLSTTSTDTSDNIEDASRNVRTFSLGSTRAMPLCALLAWPTHKIVMISHKTILDVLKEALSYIENYETVMEVNKGLSDEIAEFYANTNANALSKLSTTSTGTSDNTEDASRNVRTFSLGSTRAMPLCALSA